jgi:ribonuclease P protein subunit RPR2
MQHHSYPGFIRISTREKYVFHQFIGLILPKLSQSLLESSSHGHLVVYTCLHCKSSKGIPAPPTLNLALATGTGTGTEILEDRTSIAVLGSPESSSLLTMAPPSQSQVQKEEKKKKLIFSPRPRPRPLPLFARPDAGHVIFRGNEVLDQQGGLGV